MADVILVLTEAEADALHLLVGNTYDYSDVFENVFPNKRSRATAENAVTKLKKAIQDRAMARKKTSANRERRGKVGMG